MSKIRDRRLFEAVYDVTQRALKAGNAPTRFIAVERGFLRFTSRQYVISDSGAVDAAKVDQCLIVRDSHSDKNRFSGIGTRHVGVGGVYFSTQVSAMLAEARYYANVQKNVVKTLLNQAVIQLHSNHPLLALDLSQESNHADSFLKALMKTGEVQAAIEASPVYHGATNLKDLVFHPWDYSVSRAIGLAVGGNLALDGVVSSSARRSTRGGESEKENIVLFGPVNQMVTKKLTRDRVLLFEDDLKSSAVITRSHDVSEFET